MEKYRNNFGNVKITREIQAMCMLPMQTNKTLTFPISVNNLTYFLPHWNTFKNAAIRINPFKHLYNSFGNLPC